MPSTSSVSAVRATMPPWPWAIRSMGTPGCRAQPLEQFAQATSGVVDVRRRVRGHVGALGGRTAPVGEADHVGGGIAQGRGGDGVDRVLAAFGHEAGDLHGQTALLQPGRDDAGRRTGLPRLPPVVGRGGEAVHVGDRRVLDREVNDAPQLVELGCERLGDLAPRPSGGRPGRIFGPVAPSAHDPGQTGPFVRLALGLPQLLGHQVDLGRTSTEQPRRVEVGIAGPHAEVEPVLRGAERLALADVVAPADGDVAQEGVAGAQTVGVEDDDVEAAGHRTGEDHLASGGGAHGRAGNGGVLEAAVPGVPVLRRRAEGVDDRCVDRRPVRDGTGAGGRGAPGHGREERDERGQHDGCCRPAHGDPQVRMDRWGEGSAGGSVSERSQDYTEEYHMMPRNTRGNPKVLITWRGGTDGVPTSYLAEGTRRVRAGARRALSAAGSRPWCGFGTPGSR